MSLLIVEDDTLMQMTFKSLFKGLDVTYTDSAEEAEELLGKKVYACLFLDINLKGEKTGLDLLKSIHEKDSFLPIVMISGHEEPEIVKQCFELGAMDYVAKGTVNPEAYKLALYKASLWRKLKSESEGARFAALEGIGTSTTFRNPSTFAIYGESENIQKLRSQIERLGDLPGPFLIRGETGTGKELVARALWNCKKDRNRPFIAVNCASLPENLIESELFGYERGAFTGALTSKAGLFEAANGGDIFLDEIGELGKEVQSKLLRVLQEKSVRRLGADRERPLNVRVICATHVDIPQAVEEGAFREDLFYRLNVHVIEIAPLRDRQQDVEKLLRQFLDQVGLMFVQFGPGVLERVRAYRWPGNVRQVKTFVEYLRGHLDEKNKVLTESIFNGWEELNRPRSSRKASSTLPTLEGAGVGGGALKTDVAHIKQEVQQAFLENKTIAIVDNLDQVHRHYVESALMVSEDNRTRAAKLLGVSRQRLCNWLSQWGLG